MLLLRTEEEEYDRIMCKELPKPQAEGLEVKVSGAVRVYHHKKHLMPTSEEWLQEKVLGGPSITLTQSDFAVKCQSNIIAPFAYLVL